MNLPEEYVKIYSIWEKSPYSSVNAQPLHNQLIDLHNRMTPEEKLITSDLMFKRHQQRNLNKDNESR